MTFALQIISLVVVKLLNFNVTKLILVFAILALAQPAFSQSTEKVVEEATKKKEKREEAEKKAFERAQKKARKEHYERQSERTKEMMKRSKENSDGFNKEKKRPFFERVTRKIKFYFKKRRRSKLRKLKKR